MHYHCEVWIEKPEDIDKQVAEIMNPFEENYDTDPHTGFWDWYQIGGRWTGIHTPVYKPDEDPENIETCDLCGGTGKRNDLHVENGCNGCKGTGKRTKWPTQWKRHYPDCLPVNLLPETLSCATLIVNGKAYHTEEWNGNEFVKTGFNGEILNKLKELSIDNGFLVTVDYHS